MRDEENLTELHELRVTNLLTITGILNATYTPTSTVSRANQINLNSDILNTNNPMVFFKGAVNGYNDLIYDPNIRITYNPSTATMNFSTAILNLSNTSRAYIKSGEYSTDTPSLTLGEPNGLNEGVLEFINNGTLSNLIEANSSTGNLELWKNAGGTASNVAIFHRTHHHLILV